MKQLFSILLSIILPNTILAQISHEWQFPVPAGHHYSDVQLLGNNMVVAVGLEGTFVRSDDGGITWNYHYAQTQANLTAVYFTNSDTGYVTALNYCNFANLLKTTDGGITWDSIATGLQVNLKDVFFINNDTGWVTGFNGTILRTNDGGSNWINQSLAITTNLNTITMLDSDTGFVAGDNGKMYKTSNGGSNWFSVNTGTLKNIYSIYFTSYQKGYLGAYGELIKGTTDGGTTWNQQYDYGSAVEITSLFFTDSVHGFAISPYRYYRTTNGGNSWSFTSDYQTIKAAAAIDASGNGIRVGYSGNIQKTSDNGVTWNTAVLNNNSLSLNSITFTDKTHGWAVGDGRLLLRTTNGKTWTQVSVSPTGGVDGEVQFLNNNLGYIVGDYGIVKKTTNSGNTFTNMNTGGTAELRCLHFVDANTGWVAGNNSALYKTTNGGTTWTAQTLPNFVSFIRDLFFVNVNIGFAGGTNNQMFKTINSGATWVKLLNMPLNSSGVNHIQFMNADTGYICTENGMVSKTTDGGLSWQNTTQLAISPAYGLHFYDEMNGFVGGGTVNCDAKLYRTNDGGITWQNTHLPFAFDINSVYMTDTNSVYIAGENSNLLHFGDSVTSMISNIYSKVKEFSFTIYPNPASKQVSISCDNIISEIVITDIEGRVVILKHQNSNETNFISNILHDGIYFVTVRSHDNYSGTKKLIVKSDE